MTALRRRCLCGCGELVTGSRCSTSRRAQRAKYKGDWPEFSRATIAVHVARHGWTCPGYSTWHQPHPSTDLVCDHQAGVMCRSVNTAKRNRGEQ